MTSPIVVRDARLDEAGFVMEMTRRMVVEQERYGGRAAATDQSAWDEFAAGIAEELKGDKAKYLIAETADLQCIGLAVAKIVILGGTSQPKKTIHLSVVYVVPSHRRARVGSTLISRVLDWGRAVGGTYCSLNVLVQNPAGSIYMRHGFSEVAINMTRPL